MFSLMSLRKQEEYEPPPTPRYTMGMCRIYPINTLFLICAFPIFFVTPIWYFCPSQRTQGWNKPESVLFDHLSAVFLFIGVSF